MKKIYFTFRRRTLAALLGVAFCTVVAAHPGHDKSITQDEAVQRANAEIARLVESSKLERSWALNAKLQTADLRAKGSAKEWALTFANDKATDAAKRTLFVFLSESGEYLAANFTGR